MCGWRNDLVGKKACDMVCCLPVCMQSKEERAMGGNLTVVIVTSYDFEYELRATKVSNSRHPKYKVKTHLSLY